MGGLHTRIHGNAHLPVLGGIICSFDIRCNSSLIEASSEVDLQYGNL